MCHRVVGVQTSIEIVLARGAGKEDLGGEAVHIRRRIAVGGILVHTN